MIIEYQKGYEAFSRLILDCRYNDYRISKRLRSLFAADASAEQKAESGFLLLYHCNRNLQISKRNLDANHRFAVEIFKISTLDCRYNHVEVRTYII